MLTPDFWLIIYSFRGNLTFFFIIYFALTSGVSLFLTYAKKMLLVCVLLAEKMCAFG